MNNTILTIYKDAIEEQLHKMCQTFCLIGFPHESPRWVNVNKLYKEDDKFILQFKSTQCSLGFNIYISENHYNRLETFILSDYLWDDFKTFRTEFLKEYYPTIKTI